MGHDQVVVATAFRQPERVIDLEGERLDAQLRLLESEQYVRYAEDFQAAEVERLQQHWRDLAQEEMNT